MRRRHAAYGLDLHCSFELPGMRAGNGEGLPTVALELVGAAEIERAWSGASDRYSWTGRLGDGCALEIETGVGGELRFSYGDRARFLLSDDGELLRCAPLRDGMHWQRVLLSRVLPDVALARGYEALHASALESPEGVVAIAAPSGAGKTTLALALMSRGWRLFADDVLVLGAGRGSGTVTAHPGTPHMNVDCAGPAPLPRPAATLGTLAGEHWIAVAASATEPQPLRMVCLFQRGRDLESRAEPLSASPLALAPYMLGLEDDSERERHRFALYADTMQTTSLARLSGGPDSTPELLADLVEQALAQQRPGGHS